MSCNKKEQRIGETKLNNQGSLMKIVEYNNASNIVIEFQDEYKTKIKTGYDLFSKGSVKNPYAASVCGVGAVGTKYPRYTDAGLTKEYTAWHSIIKRCYDDRSLERYRAYRDVTCCCEWLCFENFYEWLHSQKNFDKWKNGYKWAIDKDIIIKGNKIYSSEACCLVPQNVNSLFVKRNKLRGECLIGVHFDKEKNKYRSVCSNPFTGKVEKIGRYETQEEAFEAYKKYKENLIKQVAKDEYSKSNITKECYEAMMNYEVEITD